MSGTGTLYKTGTGTLTLTNSNTSTGQFNINGGIVQIGTGSTNGDFAGSFALATGTRLIFKKSNDVVFAGSLLTGGGIIQQAGTGTLTLTGFNNGNRLAISSGTLVVSPLTGGADNCKLVEASGGTIKIYGNTAITSYVPLSLTGPVTFDINGTQPAFKISGLISGAGSIIKTGATATDGTLTLSNAGNTFSGGIKIDGGILNVAASGAAGTGIISVLSNSGLGGNPASSSPVTIANDITISSSARLTLSQSLLFTGNITGGAVNGPLPNTHSDTVQVEGNWNIASYTHNSGNIYVGGFPASAVASGAINAPITLAAGTLNFTRPDNYTHAYNISGVGGITKSGAGSLTLTGTNTFTGGTAVSGGSLVVSTTSLTGNATVSSGAKLVFNQNSAGTFAGKITGAGAVQKTGSGTLTLSNTSFGGLGYTGGTTVSAGRLNITGTVSGNALVQTGATLGGTGTVSGAVTIENGGHVAPGISPGTITLGSLFLDPTSNLDFKLAAPGGTSDLISVVGGLTLDGLLNITNAGGFTFGTYRLINYGGSLTNNTLDINSVPSGFKLTDFTVQTSVAGQVNLIVKSSPSGPFEFWNGSTTSPNGTVNGGSGTWDNRAANTNWTTASGTSSGPWSPGNAIFAGSAGNVTLGDNVSVSNIQFATSGYVINGGAFTITPSLSASEIRVDGNARIAAQLTGAGGINKTGPGSLLLSGANNYSGGTIISSGTLQVGDGGTAGSLVGNVVNNGVFSWNKSGSDAFGGIISGSGILNKLGAGTLTLSGANTYTGGTVLNAGQLEITGSGGLGTGLVTVAGSSTLSATNGLAPVLLANNIAVNAPLLVTTGAGTTLQLSGDSSGAGDMTLDGSTVGSRIEVLGNLAHTGGTTAQGRVWIGNGGTSGSISGNILADNASIQHWRSDDTTLAGNITGTGQFIKEGSSTLTLLGDLNLTSSLQEVWVNAGVLRVGNGGTSGTLSGWIQNSAQIVFERSDTSVFAGQINGSGSVVKRGGGTLVVTGSNSFTGGTTVEAGTLQIGDGGTAGSIGGNFGVNSGATLAWNKSTTTETLAGAISGGGRFVKDGCGILTLTGLNTYSGGTIVNSGTLRGSSLSVQGDILNNAVVEFAQPSAGTYAGDMTGTGSLVKSGTGTLGVSGALFHTGGTSINAGRLDLLDGGSLAGNVVVAGNAVFGVNQASDLILPGVISGAGSFVKDGAGTTTLAGANTYTGGTTVNSGVLQGTTASLQGAINNFAVVRFGQETDGDFVGVISGTGSVQKTGAGTLGLSGNHPYTGTTELIGGAIRMDSATLGTSQFNVGVGTTLSGSGSIAGNLVNGGTVFPSRIGGLAIGGDFTQLSTGVLVIEVASATSFSKLDISGKATLDGVVRVVRLDSYIPKSGDRIKFLTAASGVNGKFAALSQTGSVTIQVV